MSDLERLLSSEISAATPYRVLTLSIFIAAIIHTFMANHFTSMAKKVQKRHGKKVSVLAEILHFFGEIEIVFALWVIPLVIVTTLFYGWDDVGEYLNSRIYVEPFFVVVLMVLSSTRPILNVAKKGVHAIAKFFGDTSEAWCITILTVGPLLGSLITETAAMVIAALLIRDKLFIHHPSKRLAYGTLGLLFVHFSVGGVLTNFAAPPALTLSRCWNWTAWDFFGQFGWRVLMGILITNIVYFWIFRKDFREVKQNKTQKQAQKEASEKGMGPVPLWITIVHLVVLIWTIAMAHYPPVFVGTFLLFLGFHQATRVHQYRINLKRPLMVGLFLAGLVIHSAFQGWWIEPLIGDLGFGPLMLSGTVLTAFNENTTVAYLACLLDDLQPALQYALVCGLVAGGGLTIIAHAPNPATQSFLRDYFRGGISPWNLFLAALLPTLIFLGIFYFLAPVSW